LGRNGSSGIDSKEKSMSNEILAILIAIIIMVPSIMFYHLVIVRNYLDNFLPPTVKSLFSNGQPRNLTKKRTKKK
jgi:hypothetical protein